MNDGRDSERSLLSTLISSDFVNSAEKGIHGPFLSLLHILVCVAQVLNFLLSGLPQKLLCMAGSPSSQTCGPLEYCWRNWPQRVECHIQVSAQICHRCCKGSAASNHRTSCGGSLPVQALGSQPSHAAAPCFSVASRGSLSPGSKVVAEAYSAMFNAQTLEAHGYPSVLLLCWMGRRWMNLVGEA